MTADQWAARLLAIHAAKEAGDPLPFGILCAQLAALEAKASAATPLALTVIDPEGDDEPVETLAIPPGVMVALPPGVVAEPKKTAKKAKPAKGE